MPRIDVKSVLVAVKLAYLRVERSLVVIAFRSSQLDSPQHEAALGNPRVDALGNLCRQHALAASGFAMNDERRRGTSGEVRLDVLGDGEVGAVLIQNLRVSVHLFNLVEETTIDAERAKWNLEFGQVLLDDGLDFQ